MRVRHRNSERGDVDYFYDDNAVIEEHKAGDGSLLAHYRYADRLISLETGDQQPETRNQFYHHDALGSTVNLTDKTGAVIVAYWLDPWGHIRKQEGESVNRQVFIGQEHDEKTGLIYFGSRYYDPDTARFITQDSYLGEQGTPPSLDRYLYAYSNPTVYIDLEGYRAIDTEEDLLGGGHGRQEVRDSWAEERLRVYETEQRIEGSKDERKFISRYMTGEHPKASLKEKLYLILNDIDKLPPSRRNDAEVFNRVYAKYNATNPVYRFRPEWKDVETSYGVKTRFYANDIIDDAREAFRTEIAYLYNIKGYNIEQLTIRELDILYLNAKEQAIGQFVAAITSIAGGAIGREIIKANKLAEAEKQAGELLRNAGKENVSVGRPPARPSWQKSEADAFSDLSEFGFKKQRSYLKGKEVKYGTPGSVRPDLVGENLKLSVDIKNYNLTTAQGRYNLVQDVVKQTSQRANNLPVGLRQGVIVDIRGQEVSDQLLNSMVNRIVKKSNGLLQSENIYVVR